MVKDREAWPAVHEVAKSRTQLSYWTTWLTKSLAIGNWIKLQPFPSYPPLPGSGQRVGLKVPTLWTPSQFPWQPIWGPQIISLTKQKTPPSMISCFSHVWLFVSPWTVACQASVYGVLQVGILEWVAIPFSRGSSSPALQADSLPSEPPGKPETEVKTKYIFLSMKTINRCYKNECKLLN